MLISGASSGIGLASALALAQAGWRTIATVRDPNGSRKLHIAAEAQGVALDVQRLDVTDPESVEKVRSYVDDTYGRLDAVVNNAGSAGLGTIELMTMQNFRACMEVNFFGAVTVTKSMFPLLRASRGRILSISSIAGALGQPFNEAYCSSKFALEGFMESLHPVARTVGVTVCLVEPAAVSSAFVANAHVDIPGMLDDAGPYRAAMEKSLARTQRQFEPSKAETSEAVAAVVVDLLESAEPPLRTQTTPNARAIVALKIADLDGSRVTELTHSWLADPVREPPRL